MTIKVIDRAFETTTTTGTTTVVLQGALAGFQSFAAAGNGAKVLYQINDGDSSGVVQKWEVGIGTVTVGTPNTLSRDTVLSSSNNNQPVSFGSGPKNVIGDIAANALATRDEKLNFLEGFGAGGGTATAHTVTLPLAPLGYSDGMRVYYYPPAVNTGAFTVNVNNLGNKSVKFAGADPAAGAVATGVALNLIYNNGTGSFDLQPTASLLAQFGCKARPAGNAGISNGVSVVALGAEDYDDGNWHDNATNNTRITPGFIGRVNIAAQVGISYTAAGTHWAMIYKNGSQLVGGYGASGANVVAATSIDIDCIATDYFELYCGISTTGTPAIIASLTSLSARRIK